MVPDVFNDKARLCDANMNEYVGGVRKPKVNEYEVPKPH